MCNLITHSLALLNVKHLVKIQNHNFQLIERIPRSIEIIKKILTNFLDDLIDSQFLFD